MKMSDNNILLNKEDYDIGNVIIACPICKASKFIHIPRDILKPKGLTTISIPKDSICNHQFQLYIDNNLKVRGYQKVDFELIDGIKETNFNCQLCNAKIRFRIDDENSYLENISRNIFFGKEFLLYKVAHYFKNELHINNVFVDKTGRYYDQLSSSKIKLEEYTNKELGTTQQFYRYSGLTHETLKEHTIFNLFIIFNISDHWIYDMVCIPSINAIQLTSLLYEKIQEAKKVYSEVQKYLKISVADQEFQLRVLNSNIICYKLTNDNNLYWVNPLMEKLTQKSHSLDYLISKCPRILTINEYFNEKEITLDKIPVIQRLIDDDLLYSKIQIKYKERLPRIIDRLTSAFKIEREILEEFFNQEMSLIDFLNKRGILSQLEQFIEIYDFINRRKLFE